MAAVGLEPQTEAARYDPPTFSPISSDSIQVRIPRIKLSGLKLKKSTPSWRKRKKSGCWSVALIPQEKPEIMNR